jgi:thiamine biosynthesis protein ThiS
MGIEQENNGEDTSAMNITVNGESRNYPTAMTIAALLQSLGVNPQAVVVERNLKIVPRTDIDKEIIEEGDNLEIIRMVGGG